jgi:hypothetical protein
LLYFDGNVRVEHEYIEDWERTKLRFSLFELCFEDVGPSNPSSGRGDDLHLPLTPSPLGRARRSERDLDIISEN